MILKGLDVGYAYTKDDKGNKFRSAYSRINHGISNSNQIVVDGETYFVGTGKMTTEADKTHTDINKICTVMNLAISGDTDYVLGVGLPIGQFETQKEKLKTSIFEYSNSEVIYRGKTLDFNIRDVLVYPQGASAIYSFDKTDRELLLIDIGGITIDISLLDITTEGINILKVDTWYAGLRTLYSKIIEITNNEFSLKLENDYAEKILLNGLQLHGERQDMSYLKPVLLDYVEFISDQLKTNYPTDTTPIYLVGGGAYLLHSSLNKRLQNVKMISNPQFANANGYYKQASLKYRMVS